jgi:hypothetical protein
VVRVVIDLDPATGQIQVSQAPGDRFWLLGFLEQVRHAVLAAPPQPGPGVLVARGPVPPPRGGTR